MPRHPQPIGQILGRDPMLAGWQERAAREAALTLVLRRHLPRQLGVRVRVVALAGTAVELVVGAGAIAAALRQRLPDLLAAFTREGLPCAPLTVRVALGVQPETRRREPRPPVDRSVLRPLANLAAELPEGPLKLALGRLIRRSG